VNTGVAEKSQLNATKTVDKFVELINRDHGSKVRASNDNGKLRIENLSTQELNVGIDLNGNDAIVGSKIEGNSVRANLSKQFNELRDQLDKLSDDSSFNGINLLRGDKLKITFNESGTSSIDIQAKDKNGNIRGINASNLGVDSLVAEDLDTDDKIDAFLSKLSSALTELRSQASSFGSNLSSVENRQSFTKNMINTLETGAANLTLADTNEEAANLLALQTRQQLSSSALSMASQQDQAVLQLLR
jgi:flagellin-like hook-associated protein FlgL